MAADHPVPPVPRAERIASVNVFRGLTMLLMLFVNDINDYGVKHAPWFLYHMDEITVKRLYRVDEPWPENGTLPPEVDANTLPKGLANRLTTGKIDFMTVPDVIFPIFLFIVGLSIPIALERRIALGDSTFKLCGHVVLRSLEMIVIGLCMMNMGGAAPVNGMSGNWWRLLLFPSMILLWNRYPRAQGAMRWLFSALRLVGAGMLIYLLVIFRQDGNTWLSPGWWGIIGLIGWAYLLSALVWLAARDLPVAVMGGLALLIAFRLGSSAIVIQHADGSAIIFYEWWRNTFHGWLIDPGSLAGLSTMVFAGMAIATLFRPASLIQTPRSRIAWILVFAAGFAAAAFLVRPILGLGIVKGPATPAYCLYTTSIACTIYALLYWLVDLRKVSRWTALVAPAGSNTLLMYMLPWIVVFSLAMFGIDYSNNLTFSLRRFGIDYSHQLCEGWWGVGRAAVMAVCLLGVTALLTRCRIRLQL